MARVFLGIGSNLGNRAENIHKAIQMLTENGLTVEKVSSLLETRPWGLREQPDFINAVIEAQTSIIPIELLDIIKDIEKRLGRAETVRWGPRCIDIDILLYNDMIIDNPMLQVPHPLMHRRGFVLRPLAEIAPELVHPVLKKDIKTLLEEFDEDDQC